MDSFGHIIDRMSLGTWLTYYFSDLTIIMPNIADQVCADVNKCLKERGLAEMDRLKTDALKSQVIAVVDREHSVHKLIGKENIAFNIGFSGQEYKYSCRIWNLRFTHFY